MKNILLFCFVVLSFNTFAANSTFILMTDIDTAWRVGVQYPELKGINLPAMTGFSPQLDSFTISSFRLYGGTNNIYQRLKNLQGKLDSLNTESEAREVLIQLTILGNEIVKLDDIGIQLADEAIALPDNLKATFSKDITKLPKVLSNLAKSVSALNKTRKIIQEFYPLVKLYAKRAEGKIVQLRGK
jgi:hypothetical protein